MGDGWTLKIDVMTGGLAWGVRSTDWRDDAPKFRSGMARRLDVAQHEAEASHAVGPIPFSSPLTADELSAIDEAFGADEELP